MKKRFTFTTLLLLVLCSVWAAKDVRPVWTGRTVRPLGTENTVRLTKVPNGARIAKAANEVNAGTWGPVTVKLDPASTDSYGWNQVGLWAWVTDDATSTNLFDTWPGIAVSKDAETGWWSYTFDRIPEGELHIIWNDYDNGNQTNDIDGVESATCYQLTGRNRSHQVVDCPEPGEVAAAPAIYSRVWPVVLDNTTKSAWKNKIPYDFTGNEYNNFLYLWDNTYSVSPAAGLNFYGNSDGYLSLSVGGQSWAGASFSVTDLSLTAAEDLRKEIVANPDKYYLHMAVKSTDHYAHAFYLFGNEATKFVLGDHSVYDGAVLQDFPRDGEWHEINVPLSTYADALAKNEITNANANLFVMLSEGVQGAQLNLDAVFIGEYDYEYDAEYGFAENFADYTATPYSGFITIEAYNGNNAIIGLSFVLPEGCDTLAAGTYTISASGEPMTVKASEGYIYDNIQYSFTGYLNSEGYINVPLWYLVEGTVTVGADGIIEVNALNSNAASVQCRLTPQDKQTADPTVPTEADLAAAGYNTTENIVLAYKFGVEPCYDVVIAGSYLQNGSGGWETDPEQLVHMSPLKGFEGWFAAEIPYSNGGASANQAKPVQLDNIGQFSWDYQSGDANAWVYRGGNQATVRSGFSNEADVYYPAAGAYIYEIAYWKNNNNPCKAVSTSYTVYFKAPKDAPESVEIIGTFDNWTGTAMSYDAQNDIWSATITATASAEFKFREAGTWNNQIAMKDSQSGLWTASPNLVFSDYLQDNNIVYADFSDADLYCWTAFLNKYVPYNLKAVSVAGKVEFSWEATVVSDEYILEFYDVNDNYNYIGYLRTAGGTSYTYMVEDFLDGMELMWSVVPMSPYYLGGVPAETHVTMHKSEVELTNFVLSTKDSVTLDLTWDSNVDVPQYIVEVSGSNSLLREDTVYTAEYHYTAPLPGNVIVYVLPLNAEGEAIGRYTYAGSIDLTAAPVPFYNLRGEADGHNLAFAWEGPAESVWAQIFRMVDGIFYETIYEGVVTGHSMQYTVEEDGNYALQLQPWNEFRPGEYGTISYFEYVIVQAFTVPTYSVVINATEGGYVWPTGLSGNYPEGYVLNVNADAYTGYVFAGWSDGVSDYSRTIVVSGDTTITALFKPEGSETGMDNTFYNQTAKKVFKNGNVYILRDNKTYTLTGQVVTVL